MRAPAGASGSESFQEPTSFNRRNGMWAGRTSQRPQWSRVISRSTTALLISLDGIYRAAQWALDARRDSGRCGSSIRGRRRWWVRSDGCRASTQGVLMNATRSCRRTAVGSAGWLTIPMRNPLHRPLSSSSHPGAAMPHMLVGTCAAPAASRRTPRSPTAALPAVPTLWPESCHRGHTDGNPSRHGMYPKECRLQAAARRWRLTMSA
jgi:hypothetical protein